MSLWLIEEISAPPGEPQTSVSTGVFTGGGEQHI